MLIKGVLLMTALLFCLVPSTMGCEPDELMEEEEVEPRNNEVGPGEEEEIPQLPEPEREGEVSLEETLYHRASLRDFTEAPLELEEGVQLLWSAAGQAGGEADINTGATRTAPSAGGTHPMEVYLVAGEVEELKPGVYRYLRDEHALEPVTEGDLRNELAEAALGQEFIADAPATVVLVAHYERTTGTYGERGERYVHMEAGNISQNLHLKAEALELGTVVVGAFEDEVVADLLDTEGAPLLIMPVGRVP